MAADKRDTVAHAEANPSLLLCLDPLGAQRSDKPLGGVIKAWAPSSASQGGSGVWTNANVWPVGHITRSLAIDTARFVEISIDATASSGIIISHVTYWMRTYARHGPRYVALRTSADGFATNVAESQIDDSLPLTRIVLQTATCLRLNAGADAPAEPALHRASRALMAGTLLCRRGDAAGIPAAASDDDDDTEMEIESAAAAAAPPGVAGPARGGAGALMPAAAAAAAAAPAGASRPPAADAGPGARAGMDGGPLRLRLYFWGATGDDWADVASSASVDVSVRGGPGAGSVVAEAVAEERDELLRCCGGKAGAGAAIAVGGVKVWGWPVDFERLRADQAAADAARRLRALAIAGAAAAAPVAAAAAPAAMGGAGAAASAPVGGDAAATAAAAAEGEDNYARMMRLAELRVSNAKAGDASAPLGNDKGGPL